MSSRSWRHGLGVAISSAVVTAVLVGLPASPSQAARPAPGRAAAPASVRVDGAQAISIAGLYAFEADGEYGWLLLHHDLATGAVSATLHLDGHARREYLRAYYYPWSRQLRMTRYAGGYRHEYSLWLSYREGGKPSFGGFGDRYPLLFPRSVGRTAFVYRYGVHARYVADDSM